MNQSSKQVLLEPLPAGMQFVHRNGHIRVVTMTTRQGVYFRTPQSRGLGHRYQRWEQWRSWQRNANVIQPGGQFHPSDLEYLIKEPTP